MGYLTKLVYDACNRMLKYTTIYLSIYSRIVNTDHSHQHRRALKTTESSTCSIPLYYDASVINLSGDDVALDVAIPFSFPFYGQSYNKIGISTNGLIMINSISSSYINVDIPSSYEPNGYIAPFWTDLITNTQSIFMYSTESSVIIQWTNMGFFGTSIPLGTFQAILYNNGTIQFWYISLMGSDMSFGSTATVGIESMDGLKGTCILYQEPILLPNTLCTLYYVSETVSYSFHCAIDDSYTILLPNTMPKTPSLLTPYDSQEYSAGSIITFSWSSTGASYYKLYVALDLVLANVIYENLEIYGLSYSINDFASSVYYWKIYACNTYGCTESCIQQFTIQDYVSPSLPPPSFPPPSPLPSPPPPSPTPPSPPPPSPPPSSPPPPSPPPPSPPPPSPPPSPPPPSPPPPSPPPPSPPPPPAMIEPAAIEQIAAVVSAAVTTAVAASVSAVISSSVAGSVGGSVGGASSVPSPAGLVSMISTVQSMNMKMNLQIGGIPDTFKGLAGGVGWINLDFSLPKSGASKRLLLATGEPIGDPFEKAAAMFIFSFLLFLLPISIIHAFVQYYMLTRKGKHLHGIMMFPQIELTICLLLVTPYTKAAASLFSLGTTRSIFAGFGMLFAIPIPILCLSIFAIHNYILHRHVLKYVEFQHNNNIHHRNKIIQFIRRALLASENKGYWKGREQHLMDKYGVFFKSIRGPTYTFKNRIVRYDENTKRYKWGSVVRIHEKLVYLRAYYKSYFVARMVIISLLLNAFSYSPNGNIIQPILLVIMLTIHVYFIMFVAPFNAAKDQFTDITSNTCELGTYAAGLGMLISRRLHLIWVIQAMEKTMFSFQIMSIGIQIITQLWNVVMIFQLVRGFIIEKFYKEKTIIGAYHQLLMKKYANRWLYRVHQRPISAWKQFYKPEKTILFENIKIQSPV